MDYYAYLRSDEWHLKRERRALMDGKCVICGKTDGLNVHHLTYERVPNELPSDLVTLCRHHHLEIEKRKRWPGADSFYDLRRMLEEQFCKEYEPRDYSGGGDLDLCSLKVIKATLWPYLKERMGNADWVSGSSNVQIYFRNIRWKIIMDYMKRGFPPHVVQERTRFSSQMIRKVYNKPEIITRTLETYKSKGGFNK